MYHCKYKHKHASRRARLFPVKVEPKTAHIKDISDSASYYFGLQELDRQRQLAAFSQQQNAGSALGGLFGAATLFGGAR